jgi:hypothetical protein
MTVVRISRREFVRGAAVGGGAILLGASAAAASAQAEEPKAVPRRKFERIDIEVPILSLGTVPLTDSAPISRGFEWGMNFVHTCAAYGGGRAIRAVAKAIEGKRDKWVLGLKAGQFTVDGLKADLEILGTDHIDIIFYPTENPEVPLNEDIRKEFERMKEAGLVRGLGLTSHGRVPEVLEAGLKAGWWDVLMPACNPASAAQIDPIIERAAEKGIGGLNMKSLRGVSGDDARKAWANTLAKKHWTSIVRSVNDEGVVDRMGAFGNEWEKHVDPAKETALAAAALGVVCTGCGHCTTVCPKGISAADILRYEMYAVEYGWRNIGREAYASLPEGANALACIDCGTCVAGCKGRLQVPSRLRQAHAVLA